MKRPSHAHRLFGRPVFSLIAGLAIAVFGSSWEGGGTVAAQSPNACGLLTADEVHALAPTRTIHDGVASAIPEREFQTCRYTWGDGTNASSLVVSVNPASRMFAGMTPDAIKQRLSSTIVPETADAVISDVGEAAVFKAHSALFVSASAYLKGRVLQLNLDGFDAREQKGQLLSLLKSAASRL